MDVHLLERYRPKQRDYQPWTTGQLSPDARAYLVAHRHKTKKYNIGWRVGEDVLAYFERTSNGALRKILNEFYLHEPGGNIG